jgi:maleylacetoacetate isomerase
MKLFDYFRSSAAYRVRIALNLKGIVYQHSGVNLLRGEDNSATYHDINPQGLVPALEHNGQILTQSLAICEYIDEINPEPPLLPGSALDRAKIRALAQVVACDIHPVDNLRVLKYLTTTLGISEEDKLTWYRHWIIEGLNGFEKLLANGSGSGHFCYGDSATLADLCLIPQVFNAKRFEVDLTPYPRIRAIENHCLELDAFAKARPEVQPDAT